MQKKQLQAKTFIFEWKKNKKQKNKYRIYYHNM